MSNKRIVRTAVHILVMGLVAWGIFHSTSKSAKQLQSHRASLAERAAKVRSQSTSEPDAEKRQQLIAEADRLSASVDDYWKAKPSGLLLAMFFYACGMLPASWYWRECLQAMEQHAPRTVVLWAYLFGNLGKYFPGKAMVIVLRLGALEKFGIKKLVTTVTIFMETLTMMAVGGAWAAISLIWLNIDWRLTLLAIGLLIAMFVPTLPPLLRRVILKLQKGVERQKLESWTQRIHFGLILRGWISLTCTWWLFGLSLLCVMTSLPIADLSSTSTVDLHWAALGACALAVVLGFVSLLPGGAGVREVVLSAILSPVVGPTAALCTAIWLRIVWLATELLSVAFLAVWRWWQKS